jgi:hypothetical protein
MKNTTEYREGQGARENFEQAMKALFQTPKVSSKKKPGTTLRKTKKADKD